MGDSPSASASAPGGGSVRVLDVFCYNGEPIVEKRLEYLSKMVDTFVVVEARQTHSGKPKELFIEKHADMFSKYDCEFVTVDQFPPPPPSWEEDTKKWGWVRDPQAWWRELFQRERALPTVRRLAGNRPTVALVCDSDEIPSHDTINFLKKNYNAVCNHPVHIDMAVHYYNWNWKMPGERWHKAFAACTEFLKKPLCLTQIRNAQPVAIVEEDAGWHCSYFMDAETIERKLRSFAHTEIDIPKNIDEIVKSGKDIAGRPIALVPCDDPPPF